MSTISSIWSNVRHPMKSLRGICGGEAVYPLMILFALNAVDELDRAAFGVLLPEIRDHFDLDLSTTLGLPIDRSGFRWSSGVRSCGASSRDSPGWPRG
ncbi:MAG: hypothetical protein EBY80_02915 [Actinobacteria bacterium]|nr:hypothetical protein [Actinomycetota bacterium]